jgi:hypothetical protein
MPMIVIVTPRNLLSGELRARLVGEGQEYVLECWSARGMFCPACGKGTVPNVQNDPGDRWCPGCKLNLWSRLLEKGVWAVSTDNPQERTTRGE